MFLPFVNRRRVQFDVVMLTTVHRATDPRIFHCEAKTLLAEGLTVCILGPNPSEEDSAGVHFEKLPTVTSRARRVLLGWHVLEESLRLKAKLYIFHDPELFAVGLILALLGNKVIYDRHENLPVQILQKRWVPKPIRWLLVPLVWLAEWICARLLTGVIVATDGMLKLFPRRSTVLVRNYPRADTREALSQCAPVHLRRDIVIYAGGLSEIRGIRELVEAFHGIPNHDAELWLVGEFESERFRDEILAVLPENAKWLGWRTYSEVLDLYRCAKLGVLLLYPTPSHRRSLPVKLFEYLSAGLPVIASNYPELTEFVDGCGLMVDPVNVGQIREAIVRLLSDTSTIAEMSTQARRRASMSYSWEPEGQRLIRFCSEFMAHG